MIDSNRNPRRLDAEKNLRRLVIAESDLWQAYRFAELLLEHESSESNSGEIRSTKDLVTALDIALVVAYSRPFLDSRGGQHKNTALKVQKRRLLKMYSTQEQKLHEGILRQRSSEFAHSDADSYSPLISKTPFGLIPIMRNPFPYVDFERARRIKDMIAKLFVILGEEKKRLSSEIPMGSTIFT